MDLHPVEHQPILSVAAPAVTQGSPAGGQSGQSYFGRVYRAPNGKWSWAIFDRHHEEVIRGAGFRTHEDADIAMSAELHHYRSLDPVLDDVNFDPPIDPPLASKPAFYKARAYRSHDGTWSWSVLDPFFVEVARGQGYSNIQDAESVATDQLFRLVHESVPGDENSGPPIDPPLALPYRSPPDREGRFFEIQRLPSSAWRCLVKLSSGRTISWRDFGDTAEDFRRAWDWGNEWAS